MQRLSVTMSYNSREPHSYCVQREWCPWSWGDAGALKRLRQRVTGRRGGHTSDSEVFGKTFRGDDIKQIHGELTRQRGEKAVANGEVSG